jgi:predicted ATPase/Tfp pilus assembly protein PilF
MAARGRCLVILDNFEQVVGYADASVGRWLDIVRHAMFVVTSREVLRLAGETVLRVEPLAIAGDAVELFTLRARSRVAGFALTPAGRTQVVEIARLLDGLPLAIELAAARIGYLALEQLLARMQDRFSALASSRSGGTRKSTLRGAIDWSWNLLLPCEQAALAACSVFEGGFSLEAAESVFDLRAWPDAPSALDIVQALLDKSLVRALPSASTLGVDSEKPNFGMYLSIREYAAEKLQIGGAPESVLAFERHGAFYADRGSEAALALLFGEKAIAQRALLIADMDNLIVACRRAIAHDRGDVAVACLRAAWEVIELRGPYSLATSLATGVLALGGLGPEARVGALVVQGYAEQRVGRPERAHAALDEALALCRAPEELRMRGFVLSAAGATHRENGHVQEAGTCLEEAITLSRQFGLRRAEAVALGNLANLHYQHSQFDQANALYDEALALARAARDRRFEGQVLCGVAVLERHRGLLDEAEARNHQSLAALRDAGDRRFESAVLNNLAALYSDRGQIDSALACYGQALVIARELGHRRTEGIVLGNLGGMHDNAGRTAEARAHYEAALVSHREVGDQTFEGIVLLSLGVLDLDEGRFDEARASIEQALALFREQEHAVWQGIAVGELGRLALMQGEWHTATERVSQSELLLRGAGNPLALAKVLCVRGQLAVTKREIETARAAYTEAAQIAATLRVGRNSDLGRAVDALSTLLPPECPVVETRR